MSSSPLAQRQQEQSFKQDGRQVKLQQEKRIQQPYRMGSYSNGSSFGQENNSNNFLIDANGYQNQFLEESFGQKRVQLLQQGDRESQGEMKEQDVQKICRLGEILMEKTFQKESFAAIVSTAADSIEAIRQQKQFSRNAENTNSSNNGQSRIAIHLSNSTNSSNNSNNSINSGAQSTKNQDSQNVHPLSTHFSRQHQQQNSQSIRSNSQISREDFSSHQRKLEMTVLSLEQKVKEQAIIIEQKTSKNNALLRHLVELQSSMQENQADEDEKQRNKGQQNKEMENEINFLQSTIRQWQRKYEELNQDHAEIVKTYEDVAQEKEYLLVQLDKMKKENTEITRSMEIDVDWKANQWKSLWENEKLDLLEKNEEIIQNLNRKYAIVIKENEEIRGENEELLKHNEDLLGHNEELLKEYELLRSRMDAFVVENQVLRENIHDKASRSQIIATNNSSNNIMTNNSRSYSKSNTLPQEIQLHEREQIQREIEFKQQIQDLRDREARRDQEMKRKEEEMVKMRQQLEESKRESQLHLKREREKSQRELQNAQLLIQESREQLHESKQKLNQIQLKEKQDIHLKEQRFSLGIRLLCRLMKNMHMRGMIQGMQSIRSYWFSSKIRQPENQIETKQLKQNQTSSPMLLRKQQLQQVSYIEKRRMASFGKYLFFKYKKAVQREFFKKIKIIHQQGMLKQAERHKQNSQVLHAKADQKLLGVSFQTWRKNYRLSRLCRILKNRHVQAHTREGWERIIAFAETKQMQQKTMELSRKICRFSIHFTRFQLRRAFACLQQNNLVRNYSLNHRNIVFVRAVLKHKKNNLIAALNRWRYALECAKVEEAAAEINQTDSVIEKTEKIRSEMNLFLQSKEASISTLLQGSTTPTRTHQQAIPRDFSPNIDPKKLRYSPSPIKANTNSETAQQLLSKTKRIDQQRDTSSTKNVLTKPSISPQQKTMAAVGAGSFIIPNGRQSTNWFSESNSQKQLINQNFTYNILPAEKNDLEHDNEEYYNKNDSNSNDFRTGSSKSETVSKKYQIPSQQAVTSPQNHQLQLKNYSTKNFSEKSLSSVQSTTLVEQRQYFEQPENLYSEKPIQKRNKLTK